eukprot:2412227-Amphidinium_carterae.1
MAEQRIVQTGIEYERDIRREQAVVGLGQAQFAGHYEARSHMTGESHRCFTQDSLAHTASCSSLTSPCAET